MDALNQPTPTVEPSPKPGVISRIYMVFTEPSKLFGTLTGKVDWLVPLIFIAVIGSVMGYFTMPYIVESQRAGVDRMMEKYRDQMPEETYRQTMERIDEQFADAKGYKWYYPVIGVALPFVFFMIIGAICLMTGNFIFGGKASFWIIVNVIAYAALIGLLGDVVRGLMMLAKDSVAVYTGLGLLKPIDDGSFLYYLLKQIDLFSIWRIAITAVGLGVIYKMKPAKFMYVLIPIWIIFICLVAVGNMFTGGSIMY